MQTDLNSGVRECIRKHLPEEINPTTCNIVCSGKGPQALWRVWYYCPNPDCDHNETTGKIAHAQKKWGRTGTATGVASSLANTVLTGHARCFEALQQGCGEKLTSVDAEKGIAW